MGDEKKFTQFDLEERIFKFAKGCRDFTKQTPKTSADFEYNKQLIRASGSTAANYIEANECLSDKDLYIELRFAVKKLKRFSYG